MCRFRSRQSQSAAPAISRAGRDRAPIDCRVVDPPDGGQQDEQGMEQDVERVTTAEGSRNSAVSCSDPEGRIVCDTRSIMT